MKKVVFALAVAVAALSQAMNVDWKFTGSAKIEKYDVYALTAWPDVIKDASSLVSGSTAKVEKSGREYKAEGILTGLSGKSGENVDFYLALVATDTQGDNWYYKVATSGALYDPNGTDQPVTTKFDGTSLGAVGSEGWTKISGATPGPGPGDVPEPTSGLLLALGGAALALRRKQK